MKEYWIALKRKGSGKLQWIKIKSKNEKDATEKAHGYESDFTEKKQYVLYACPLISVTQFPNLLYSTL